MEVQVKLLKIPHQLQHHLRSSHLPRIIMEVYQVEIQAGILEVPFNVEVAVLHLPIQVVLSKEMLTVAAKKFIMCEVAHFIIVQTSSQRKAIDGFVR